jgi:hypothetical protein
LLVISFFLQKKRNKRSIFSKKQAALFLLEIRSKCFIYEINMLCFIYEINMLCFIYEINMLCFIYEINMLYFFLKKKNAKAIIVKQTAILL